MTPRELAFIALKSAGVTGATAWLFYRSWRMVFVLFPVCVWCARQMAVEGLRRKELEFQMQFKESIQVLSQALSTGYSVENAFLEVQKELKLIYPNGARISREFLVMVRQLKLHVPVERVLEDFAGRVCQEDVRNFVEVFGIAKRSGGDMIAIIQNTTDQIGDKIDVKREIDTILAAKQYEFQVMSAVPYFIIGYMSLSFPEFTDSLYGNAFGIGVMTVCLTIYLAAFYLGTKIVKIEV